MGVRNTTDELPLHIKKVNDALQKRAEEIGLSKKRFKDGFFKEFNIMDMYTVKGKLCFTCYKGIKCQKHPMQHTDFALTRKDFAALNAPKPKK